ncbi:MAG: Nitronate monooxygenase [Pseudoclavibacter caeni]
MHLSPDAVHTPADRVRRLFAHPIVQAPMAGVTTPELAAAVSNAGGLGSLGIGGADPDRAREAIRATRGLTDRPFAVGFFTHAEPRRDAAVEAAWLELLAPEFTRLGAEPPTTLQPIYPSAAVDDANTARLVDALVAERPAAVSFHFGLPAPGVIDHLHEADIAVLVTATDLAEGLAVQRAGADAVVAQGVEAGGHRGVFTPDRDERIGTLPLVRQLAARLRIPVVAAGGISDGAGIAAALDLGAAAAQLGTAFLLAPEAATGTAWRERIRAAAAHPDTDAAHTAITRAVSGRPARGLPGRLAKLAREGAERGIRTPDYPLAYSASKALARAAAAAGRPSAFAAHWAGQAVAETRELPAGELVRVLVDELRGARG